MFDFLKKEHQYNSRIYDMEIPEDVQEFDRILATLKEFDFDIIRLLTVDGGQRKNIHVDLKTNYTLETWLIRVGFEEA